MQSATAHVDTVQSTFVSSDGTVTEVAASVDDALRIVQETYKELNIKRVRPLRNVVFLRTDAISDTTPGGIILPPSKTRFYDGLPHQRLVTAVVLAVGPNVETLEPGMRVAFRRAQFMWHWKMQDGTYVGSIPQVDIVGEVMESWDVRPYD